ncbi:MAG: FecR domain-containing protein [Granulosicoccus sp.]
MAVLATKAHAQSATAVGSSSHKHTIISRDVLVEVGDTLAKLAQRELGKTGFAPLLAEYNKLTPTTQLVPGSIIRIPVQVPKRDEFAEVVFVKGTVTATRLLDLTARATLVSASHASDVVDIDNGTQEPGIITLSRNALVYSGDVITTSIDGYLSIAFSSGSVINLQPDTVAKLERLTCLETDDSCLIEIETQRGRVTSDVESRDQQPVEFRINTPYASAAVRGTVFDVDASQNLLVGVAEGLVDVTAQSQTVPLNNGFGLVVEEGEPPGEPIELIPGPVFKRVPSRITAGDTIEWWPFIDASSYLAVVSTDEAANETLTDLSLPEGSNLLDVKATLNEPLDAGDYFLTLRAVDINGLLGLTSNTRITLADIDPSIGAVSTNVVRQGSEFLVTVVDPPEEANGYEIQIANDEEFTDPLSVDVNSTGSAVFRLDEDEVFTRARILLDPFTVSAFGEPTSN